MQDTVCRFRLQACRDSPFRQVPDRKEKCEIFRETIQSFHSNFHIDASPRTYIPRGAGLDSCPPSFLKPGVRSQNSSKWDYAVFWLLDFSQNLHPESDILYLAVMKNAYLLAVILLLTACGGRRISADLATDAIVGIPGESLEEKDIEVLKVNQLSETEAIVDTRIQAAFRLERVRNKWIAREVRLGQGQWEKVDNLERALEAVRTEETRKLLDRLAEAILKYRNEKGALPAFKDYVALSDLLSPVYLTPVIRLDAWRRPLEATRQDSNTLLLRSAGPDGNFNTPDDIRRTVP